jgi:hypothetical protein
LSGVIIDSVSGRPIPGASLDLILPEHFPTTFTIYWPPDGLTRVPFPSDPTGHYKISGLPGWMGTTLVAVSKNGYMQQCAARATIHGDTSLDIALTPLGNLAFEPSPTTTPTAGSRTVSGVVYGVTPEGRRPVAKASVYWDADGDFYGAVFANTMSDAAGRYLLCGLPEGRIDRLFASKQGYNNNNVSVDPGTDAVVDIEIAQK